jgi:hypothetical protein
MHVATTVARALIFVALPFFLRILFLWSPFVRDGVTTADDAGEECDPQLAEAVAKSRELLERIRQHSDKTPGGRCQASRGADAEGLGCERCRQGRLQNTAAQPPATAMDLAASLAWPDASKDMPEDKPQGRAAAAPRSSLSSRMNVFVQPERSARDTDCASAVDLTARMMWLNDLERFVVAKMQANVSPAVGSLSPGTVMTQAASTRPKRSHVEPGARGGTKRPDARDTRSPDAMGEVGCDGGRGHWTPGGCQNYKSVSKVDSQRERWNAGDKEADDGKDHFLRRSSHGRPMRHQVQGLQVR